VEYKSNYGWLNIVQDKCNGVVLLYLIKCAITNPVIHSTEQNPSWEASSHSGSQEIRCLLRNLKVHYRVHKNIPAWCVKWTGRTSVKTSLLYAEAVKSQWTGNDT
jgi:hypothetical protein